MKKSQLSVIVPVYNESNRLEGLVEISQYLEQFPASTELVVVDDGSTDQTLQKLKKLKKKISFVLVSYHQNQGKGYAIKQGMLKATGEWRLFMDVDLSVPLEYVEKIWQVRSYADVVIGSRRKKTAVIATRQPKLRESMGFMFTRLVQLVLGLRFVDFTCGFKLFSEQAAYDIFSRQQIKRWSFDAEILFLTKLRDWSVYEFPVTWHNDARSKVRFPHDIISSLTGLLAIRYHHLFGSYRKISQS